MTVLTQGMQTGEFLLSEANGQRSREQVTVTIVGGTALPSGTVVGKITATGKYLQHLVGAVDGSQNAAGVLYNSLPGVNGDVKATIMARQCEVVTNRLNNGVAPIAATITALTALGIVCR